MKRQVSLSALFGGWSFGNGWQRDLEHRWCAGGCGLSLDWFQPEFLAVYPNPMCQPCGMKRDHLATTEALEADRQWAELHVIRSEVPWISTLNPKFIPPVLHEASE